MELKESDFGIDKERIYANVLQAELMSRYYGIPEDKLDNPKAESWINEFAAKFRSLLESHPDWLSKFQINNNSILLEEIENMLYEKAEKS